MVEVAAVTDTRADYIKKRAFNKKHYKEMIINYLKEFGEASRAEIDDLLMDKISDALDDDQKKTFITNLLQEMRQEDAITAVGTTRWVKWIIPK